MTWKCLQSERRCYTRELPKSIHQDFTEHFADISVSFQDWFLIIWSWTLWPIRPILLASIRPNCRRRLREGAGGVRTRAPCRFKARSILTALRRRWTVKAPRRKSNPVLDSVRTAVEHRHWAGSPTDLPLTFIFSLSSSLLYNRFGSEQLMNMIIHYQASLIWGEKLNMVFFPIFSCRNSPYLAFFTSFSRFFHTHSSLLRVLWLVSEQFQSNFRAVLEQ